MNTLLYSLLGIIGLIAVSYFFSVLDNRRSTKIRNRLAAFRQKLTSKTSWMGNDDQYKVDPSVFRRTAINTKLNIFPPNGDTPVL